MCEVANNSCYFISQLFAYLYLFTNEQPDTVTSLDFELNLKPLIIRHVYVLLQHATQGHIKMPYIKKYDIKANTIQTNQEIWQL